MKYSLLIFFLKLKITGNKYIFFFDRNYLISYRYFSFLVLRDVCELFFSRLVVSSSKFTYFRKYYLKYIHWLVGTKKSHCIQWMKKKNDVYCFGFGSSPSLAPFNCIQRTTFRHLIFTMWLKCVDTCGKKILS
jgi:hypothetical protein